MTVTRRQTLFVAALVILGFALGFVVRSLAMFPYSSAWLAVVAAFGSSLLTALAMVSVEAVRQRHAAKRAAFQRRRDAYHGFVAAAASYLALVSEIRELRRRVTKLSLGDPATFLERVNNRTAPLWDSWSQVLVVGSQSAVKAANELINVTIPAMNSATAGGAARRPIFSLLVGEKWTDDQEREFGDAMKAVGLARLAFAQIARRELGESEIGLRAGVSDD